MIACVLMTTAEALGLARTRVSRNCLSQWQFMTMRGRVTSRGIAKAIRVTDPQKFSENIWRIWTKIASFEVVVPTLIKVKSYRSWPWNLGLALKISRFHVQSTLDTYFTFTKRYGVITYYVYKFYQAYVRLDELIWHYLPIHLERV